MIGASIIALGFVAQYALAMHTLRFSCSQLVIERLDPVQIVGGNAFNTTMDLINDIGNEASCTTCTFSEDFSNYWTAVLYFRARNGTFKRVPQLPNQNLEQADGGMTVYYNTPDNNTTNITAFKPGFRMLAGTAEQRVDNSESGVNLYRCYDSYDANYTYSPNPMGVADTDTLNMPTKYCGGGIRVNTFFPTCWDGINLDSPDHKSHVTYPTAINSYPDGTECPASHPVELPQIFIETIWDTGIFDKSLWPEDGSQPFIWSQGDPTGYGHHADYVFGWKGDALQKAMDARCDVYDASPAPLVYPASGCPQLQNQGPLVANKCSQKQIAVEDLDGWLPSLPGGMPINYA